MRRIVKSVVMLAVSVLPVMAQSPDSGDRAGSPGNNVVGKVSSMTKESLTIAPLTGGEPIIINIGSDTRVMKERQPAKISDVKPGDVVFARGKLANHTLDARMVAVVNPEMAQQIQQRMQQGGGQDGFFIGPGGNFTREDWGKKFIAGEVKAIKETKLTIARPDGQAQEIEVDENTSFKRGTESITFPEIKVGDFVRGPGEVKNNVFVPRELIVGRPQMRMMFGGPGDPAAQNPAPEKTPPPNPPRN